MARFITNEEIADKLEGEDADLARETDAPLGYCNQDSLRAVGFSEAGVQQILSIRNGDEDYSKLTKVNGVGPKTAEQIYNTFGITTISELEDLAQKGALTRVDGLGPDTQAHILKAVEWVDEGRMEWPDAQRKVHHVKNVMGDFFKKFKCVGSYRRRKPTVGDLDMLAVLDEDVDLEEVQEQFRYSADYVIRCGDKKMTGRWLDTQVDIQLVTEEEWPAAVQYFTGSQQHNVELRQKAKDKGWKLNEYGLWDRETGERVHVEDEEELYLKLKGRYIEPEDR